MRRKVLPMAPGAGFIGHERDDAFLAAARTEARGVWPWALHEMRDIGALHRDLVETGERFAALHLRLEPRAKCALLGDAARGGRGQGAQAAHAALRRRAALATHLDKLYAAVRAKLPCAEMSAFSALFAPHRPDLTSIRRETGLSCVRAMRAIEAGLVKIWALEPILPARPGRQETALAVNELERF
jgi:hypothetical protein